MVQFQSLQTATVDDAQERTLQLEGAGGHQWGLHRKLRDEYVAQHDQIRWRPVAGVCHSNCRFSVQPENRRRLSTVHQMASICEGIRLVRDVFLDEENENCRDVLKGKAKESPAVMAKHVVLSMDMAHRKDSAPKLVNQRTKKVTWLLRHVVGGQCCRGSQDFTTSQLRDGDVLAVVLSSTKIRS